ncbi:LLM class flavin-dependent oxidoreductase [Streptomyces noursei]|uniref:LLM class flavin-dependent oxidoreductase n=1 Tax=Streptomyces noursei TaxID=1971 RepID=UPI0022A68FAD|nr:LLM class flavin-dependent oxidoreductase [Streptomyces noursei]MCZ1020859.1 LLM class flavin-dependent oxidoreductase [Streptomyces noursei]
MTLRLGWTVPTALSPVELREFAVTAEHLGYDHLSVPEHLVSSTPAYESLTLVAFLAAVTTRIELATAMTILPHRPVVLAAKQAAQLAHLSGDRLRLGVAMGSDPAESAALGTVPGTRAALFEEQVHALRLLWTRPAADFAGEHVAFTGVTVTPGRAGCRSGWAAAPCAPEADRARCAGSPPSPTVSPCPGCSPTASTAVPRSSTSCAPR